MVAIAGFAALLLASVAFASWSRSATGGPLSVSTATLDAPTGLTATLATCVKNTAAGPVNLSWTASTSPAVSGYEIFRATTSGGPYSSIGTTTGKASTSFSDTTVAYSTAYFYVVESSHGTWRSPNSAEATATTLSKVCK